MTVKQVYEAYRILSQCKITKMSDENKIKFWKILKELKPISDKFEEEMKLAVDKFKPFEDYDSKLEAARQYEVLGSRGEENLPMTKEEYDSFILAFKKYNELVDAAIKEYQATEFILNAELLTEDAFGDLISSNDWNAEQILIVGEIVSQQ